MIETLEDRMHHVVERATAGLDKDAQASDILTLNLKRVLWCAHTAGRQFCSNGKLARLGEGSVKTEALSAVDSALIAMHALGIEPPTLEDIADLVDEFEDVIAQDGVLSSCVITRAASDAMLSYFSDDEELSEDLVLSLGEIICGAALLVQRVGGDFNELITRKV